MRKVSLIVFLLVFFASASLGSLQDVGEIVIDEAGQQKQMKNVVLEHLDLNDDDKLVNYDEDEDDDDDFVDGHEFSEQQNVDSPTDSPVIVCEDNNLECRDWKDQGECVRNPGYMLSNCKASCGVCGKDGHGVKFGVAQTCEGEHKVACQDIVSKMETYFQETVSKPEFDKVRSRCQNKEALCSFWAAIGECENNPKYMKIHCAAACQTCEQVDFDLRCPRDPDSKDVFGPGDLHKMFERIVENYPKANILSQPKEGSTKSPWVITIDDFIKPEECDRLIDLGHKLGYARSTDVGAEKFDGTFEEKKSTTRTSENAWCTNECMDDPLTQDVLKRIEELTGIPDTNSEHLQVSDHD
jgi:prolyl 4-hydroxylase